MVGLIVGGRASTPGSRRAPRALGKAPAPDPASTRARSAGRRPRRSSARGPLRACRSRSRCARACSRSTWRRAWSARCRRTCRSSRCWSRTRSSRTAARRSASTASRATARPSTASRRWSTCRRRIAWSQFLRDPARVFAMVPTDELAALDAAFKQAHVPYYVVDASSSRFLLLTNQLAAGQRDDNPLREQRLDRRRPARRRRPKPPWTWRVPIVGHVRRRDRAGRRRLPDHRAPARQDPARPLLPRQGARPPGELQDLRPLRRAGRAARHRRPRSGEPRVRRPATGCPASTSAITTRPTCR